ncbi:hypothetical protein [Wolbachia endosymbiont (group A) of Sympetrum striolatum]|uniref:hypothetical protein n=2 Tax=unclassified Wolbachia TaxID=2640676 RepID=UPI0022268FF9|nr:hypothetical protein [Wolbachia endosymbiont (group A) of Sympetrum striolatum]MBV2146075.1 hypothetical protein [Wolbachia endosymbiont of Pissodes strobi]
MIGISQIQFPRSGSSKVRIALYLSFYYALTIVTIPTSIIASLVSTLYDTEIKTFLGYKKIKGGEKISNKEYWKIFGQGNIIKSIAVSCIAGLTIYYFFSKSLILAWLLAPIPLAIGIILLQPETRPATLNPIALLKASLKLLSDGLYENLVGTKNVINAMKEHMMPHMANDSIIDSINTLKDKYGEKIPEPNGVIHNDEFVKFIKFVEGEKELGNNNKKEFINFLNEWCNNDEQVHVSGLMGGQILYLVLKACNSGDSESVAVKRQELVKSLMYAMNYAKGTIVPETCFTGIIGAMLKSLEGIHPGIRVEYLVEDRIGICAEDEACEFIKKELQKKKNHKEILNAWDKSDDSSNQITSNFIQEIKIPLMRNLFSLDCSEQNVVDTIENLEYINPGKLTDPNIDNIRSNRVST